MVEDYFDYIKDHRKNIKLALKKYGREICFKLKINYEKLKNIIDNHDLSKFSDDEFEYYRQFYYPNKNEIPNENLLNIGWLHHQNNNKHHPEYWILRNNNNQTIILDMDNYSIAEMLLDWEAVSIAKNGATYKWYLKEGQYKIYSDNTKDKIEKLIKIFK